MMWAFVFVLFIIFATNIYTNKTIYMSLSKNKIKYIQSLKDKKHRSLNHTFVAEGEKIVLDLLHSCKCQLIAGLPDIVNRINPSLAKEVIIATEEELKKATHLKTAPPIIGVFYQPNVCEKDIDFSKGLHLILDGVQDPGNLGTIVRIADWFGVKNIICSPNTTDIYNPKTVQSTMGAIARVNTLYTDLNLFLEKNNSIPIYGTFLEGKNIYEERLSTNAFIIMGSEGKGISQDIESRVSHKLLIPSYPKDQSTSESLNVAVATAIICSEFRRGM